MPNEDGSVPTELSDEDDEVSAQTSVGHSEDQMSSKRFDYRTKAPFLTAVQLVPRKTR